jgi:hypothetical protein
MYIQTSYNASVYAEMVKSSSSTQQKTLADYLNDEENKGSFSDGVSLSAETYGALKETNPKLLASLGYSEDPDSKPTSGSSSLMDNVQLSKEAIAVLKEENPTILEALGYDVSKLDKENTPEGEEA